MSWLFIAAVVAICIACTRQFQISEFEKHLRRLQTDDSGMRALVVISHPDDEAMFFTPIIDYLTSHGHVVEVLCLSNGNDQGLGDVRTLELHAALNKTYGHNSVVNVTVVHHGDMQDGMGTKWPVDLVKKAIDVHAREKCGARK